MRFDFRHIVIAFGFIAATGSVAIASEMPTEPRIEHYDADGDGVIDTTTTWSIQGEQEVCKELDKDADGVVDRIEHRTWDTAGQLVSKAVDRDADGTIDAITRLEYDAEGRQILEAFDADNDGSDDRRRVTSWTADGKQLEAIDQGADGTFEVVKAWQHDGAGELVERVVHKRRGDAWSVTRYDGAGTVLDRTEVTTLDIAALAH